MSFIPGSQPAGVPAAVRCVPSLRLFAETLYVDDGSRHGDEVKTAVLRLDFMYGDRRVRHGDPRPAGRDRDSELQACRVLEGLGAIELSHLDDCAVSPGAGVDYVVAVDADINTLCAFAAYALPQLKNLGWIVDVAPDYPWQVVGAECSLYASAEPDEERPDWFGLELGVEVDGQKVDLLPALLDLIDGAGDLQSIGRTQRRCIAIRVDEKRWLPVPPARLKLLAKVLMELYREGKGVKAPVVRAPLIAELCSTLHDGTRPMRWIGDTRIREQAYALALGPRRTARITATA